jgi:hypothetical protein
MRSPWELPQNGNFSLFEKGELGAPLLLTKFLGCKKYWIGVLFLFVIIIFYYG